MMMRILTLEDPGDISVAGTRIEGTSKRAYVVISHLLSCKTKSYFTHCELSRKTVDVHRAGRNRREMVRLLWKRGVTDSRDDVYFGMKRP